MCAKKIARYEILDTGIVLSKAVAKFLKVILTFCCSKSGRKYVGEQKNTAKMTIKISIANGDIQKIKLKLRFFTF
jgi:hypothetical protein